MVSERAAGFTFIARALGVVAVIALVLSLLGIYSLMAFLTTQRTQEIGVRMALGAGRWQVIRAIISRALAITLVGSVVGAAFAFGIGRMMQSLLFGLVTTNVTLLGGSGAGTRLGGDHGRLPAGPPCRAHRSDVSIARVLTYSFGRGCPWPNCSFRATALSPEAFFFLLSSPPCRHYCSP